MTSNYNVLYISTKYKGKYKIGDTFKLPKHAIVNWRIRKFEGLTIKNIDYNFHIRLHFDWNEWSNNNPSSFKY